MKKYLYILSIMLVPVFMQAQTMTIGDGAVVTIGADASMSIGTAASSGTVTSDAVTKLVIESTVDGQGSLICGGTPNATVESYNTAGKWHNVSPTTSGVTVQDYYFDSNPDTWLVWHTQSDDSWTFMETLTDAVNRSQGYNFYIDGSTAKTVDYAGNLNSGDVALTTISTPALSYTATFGWNFIGNPFPCALEYTTATWTKTDVEDAVYVWNSAGSNYLNRPGAGGGSLTGGIIPMGQGFWIRTDGASPAFTIPASKRVHSLQDFYKNGAENKDNTPHLLLDLSKGQKQDIIYIGFLENTTRGFDNGFDAWKLYGPDDSPQAYINEQSLEFSTNVIELPDQNGSYMNLSFVPGEDGEHILNATLFDLAGTKVELQDLKTGVFQNLETHPVYTFNSSKSDDPARFVVHFNRSVQGINDNDARMQDISIYASNNIIYVKSVQNENQELIINVNDIYGRSIYKNTYNNTQSIEIPVNVSSGVYVVSVIREGNIKNAKVFIK